jgi:hypothetical protein
MSPVTPELSNLATARDQPGLLELFFICYLISGSMDIRILRRRSTINFLKYPVECTFRGESSCESEIQDGLFVECSLFETLRKVVQSPSVEEGPE